MALKETGNTLATLLQELQADLEKASEGNMAAAQRVRTGSIKFEKAAKRYRKESVQAAKSGEMKRTKKSSKKKSDKKAAPPPAARPAKGAAKKKSTAKKTAAKRPAAKKSAAKKPAAKKRMTAKMPKRRATAKRK